MTNAGPVIRVGDIDGDRHLALGAFQRHLNPHYDETRFDWLYRQNPYGRGRLWVATESNGGALVGIAAAFRRQVSISGRERRAWVLGDFCVTDGHRSLGPALALQRACLAVTAEDGAAFCYDFPSAGMMAVYRRLGIKPLGQMIRFVRPLGIEVRLRQVAGDSPATIPLRALARTIMAPRGRRRARAAGLEISLYEKPFNEDFSELYRRFAAQQGVMLGRSAEYLNWRYRANPVHRHQVLTARVTGRLEGYAIFTEDGQVMTVMDMLAGADHGVVAALIQTMVELAAQRRLDAVHFSLLESSPWIQEVKQAGFRRREPSPVVVCTAQQADGPVGDERAWLLFNGDRES